jgi:serine/threonine protein kinase
MLKLLDEDSRELEILEFLNSIKSDDNYVITLFRSFHLDVGTIIALPIASPLDCHDFTMPAIALDLMDQLVRAVSFIHTNGVAHLDLKPNNVLVSCTDDRPRLVVIDFGISIFVDSPETKIEGFVGTRGWVAPEIGTEHGPRQRYSAIRADLWACGQLLSHMASRSRFRQPSTRMIQLARLARALSSDDPLQRPSLETYLTEAMKPTKHSSDSPEVPVPK